MGQLNPIEVAVIRPAVSSTLPAPVASQPNPPPPVAESSTFSDLQRRELVELMEALQCEVRQRALESLAAGGAQPGEAIPVGQLAKRMGVPQPTVSIHLNILRRMGLVYTRRVGRCIEYQAAPGLVRLEVLNGKRTLTVSRPSGATVTLGATLPPAVSPEVSAAPAVNTVEPDGARPAASGESTNE